MMIFIAVLVPALDHTDDATRMLYGLLGFGGLLWCLVVAAGEYLLKKMSLSLHMNRLLVHAAHLLMLFGATRYLLKNEMLQQASPESLASIAVHCAYIAAAIPLVAIADHLLSWHREHHSSREYTRSTHASKKPVADIDFGAEFETVR